jgi:hypothetical protein
MATNETIELAHLVELTWDNRVRCRGVRAECSCGWAGDWHSDINHAANDGFSHREIEVRPPDGLDVLISALLDAQDDLAATVMWLAEHWSVDLPVPDLRGLGPNGALVDLSAYCESADELERAADALEAPLVDDPGLDTCGNRYRRANRTFGCVSLTVLRALRPTCGECGADLSDDGCRACRAPANGRAVQAGAA